MFISAIVCGQASELSQVPWVTVLLTALSAWSGAHTAALLGKDVHSTTNVRHGHNMGFSLQNGIKQHSIFDTASSPHLYAFHLTTSALFVVLLPYRSFVDDEQNTRITSSLNIQMMESRSAPIRDTIMHSQTSVNVVQYTYILVLTGFHTCEHTHARSSTLIHMCSSVTHSYTTYTCMQIRLTETRTWKTYVKTLYIHIHSWRWSVTILSPPEAMRRSGRRPRMERRRLVLCQVMIGHHHSNEGGAKSETGVGGAAGWL